MAVSVGLKLPRDAHSAKEKSTPNDKIQRIVTIREQRDPMYSLVVQKSMRCQAFFDVTIVEAQVRSFGHEKERPSFKQCRYRNASTFMLVSISHG